MALDPSVFVHEKAICESEEVGAGTRIWAFAHVMKGAVVGEGCNIGDHAFIEGGAKIGHRVTVKNAVLIWEKVTVEDEVFLGPNVVFTNDLNPRVAFKKRPDDFLPTVVKRGASIGANATIVCGLAIGEYAFVGAGSVVVSDIPAYALAVGNPARRTGWICVCGATLPGTLVCSRCGRRYRLVDEVTGLVPLLPES